MPDFVILLENEKIIRDSFNNLFQDLEIGLDLLLCNSVEEYLTITSDEERNNHLKSIIVDLANTSEEEKAEDFQITKHLLEEFETNRIPIFIHSAYMGKLKEFEGKGTVYKVPKGKDSAEQICKRIKLFNDSGFFNIFSKGGKLDGKFMIELHSAFVNQFKNNEIEEIIKSIKHASGDKLKERTNEVFERIAIRAVFENLIKAKKNEEGTLEEVKINAIEHYFRRTSEFEFWTGDVFLHRRNKDLVIILTPKCNLSHNNYEELLLCKINRITQEIISEFNNPKKDKSSEVSKGIKSLHGNITDDVTNKRVGERYRFLPRTPQFEGGYIDFARSFSMKSEDFMNNYEIVISLSEEFASDVIRKFSTYLLRRGITETDFLETSFYLNEKGEATE